MAKITFTQDFTASPFIFDRPLPNPPTRLFKKGETVTTKTETNFGLMKRLVVTAGGTDWDITNAVYTGSVVTDGSGLEAHPPVSSDMARRDLIRNIIIGIIAIGVIVGGLKLAKVF